jgi:hypothetical protein
MRPSRGPANLSVVAVCAGLSLVQPREAPAACTVEPGHAGITIHLDNDTFKSPPTDRDYTTGFDVVLSGHFVQEMPWLFRWPTVVPLNWLDRNLRVVDLDDRLCFTNRDRSRDTCEFTNQIPGHQSNAFRLGLTYFTPRESVLGSKDPQHDDRPYASILFFAAEHTSSRDRFALTSEFTFGILGLDIAKFLQTHYHHVAGFVEPEGWRHQISNGGEPTVKYRLSLHDLIVDSYWSRPPAGYAHDRAISSDTDPYDDRWFDVTGDAEVNAGFYTNLAVGARARLGLIDSSFSSSHRVPVGPVSTLPGPGAKNAEVNLASVHNESAGEPPNRRRERPRVSEVYVWIGGGWTGWLFNELMQGGVRHSDVTIGFKSDPAVPDTRLRCSVFDVESGITVRLRRISLMYQYSYNTALFSGTNTRPQSWGGFYVQFR